MVLKRKIRFSEKWSPREESHLCKGHNNNSQNFYLCKYFLEINVRPSLSIQIPGKRGGIVRIFPQLLPGHSQAPPVAAGFPLGEDQGPGLHHLRFVLCSLSYKTECFPRLCAVWISHQPHEVGKPDINMTFCKCGNKGWERLSIFPRILGKNDTWDWPQPSQETAYCHLIKTWKFCSSHWRRV